MVDAIQENRTGAEDVVWDLNVFYGGVDDPALQRDMHALKKDALAFAGQYRGQVATLGAAELATLLQRLENLYEKASRVGHFASLLTAEDQSSDAYSHLEQQSNELSAEIRQYLLFFQLEWLELTDEHVNALLQDPALAHYRHYLEAARDAKPYMLSEAEEKMLLALGVNGETAFERLYDKITANTLIPYTDPKTGATHDLTQAEIISKYHDADRDVRRTAAEALHEAFEPLRMQLTFVFNTLAGHKATVDKLRGYPTWISSRNLANKTSDAQVQALVDAVTASYGIVAEHYDIKRRLLGYEALYDYDMYAPLHLADSEQISWQAARDLVTETYSNFSPRLGEIVQQAFADNWIHAAPRKAKASGAFSAPGTPSTHPYILMTHTGNIRDVMTLAHELGHTVHQYLAGRTSGLLYQSTPLTTAEMASTFGEMLTFERLMARESDPAAQLTQLSAKIEDASATIFRQIAFNRFEDAYHTARREQGELTAAQYSAMWMAQLQAMFGASLTITDAYAQRWSLIPHFVGTPGYVYAYAFGELLVLALYRIYQQQGADFADKYIDVLSAGNSDYPHVLLSTLGVDLQDPDFWQQGLNVLRDMVQQERELAQQVMPERFA